ALGEIVDGGGLARALLVATQMRTNRIEQSRDVVVEFDLVPVRDFPGRLEREGLGIVIELGVARPAVVRIALQRRLIRRRRRGRFRGRRSRPLAGLGLGLLALAFFLTTTLLLGLGLGGGLGFERPVALRAP